MGTRYQAITFGYTDNVILKKRRKELGISTLDFAGAIGTTQTVVNYFERGNKGVGSPRLYKIAKVLSVDVY